MATLDRYVEFLRVPNAEHLTFKTNTPVELLVGGQIRPASKGPASSGQIFGILGEVLPSDYRQTASRKETDFPYAVAGVAYKLRVRVDGDNIQCVIRLDKGELDLPSVPMNLVGMPENLVGMPENVVGMPENLVGMPAGKAPPLAAITLTATPVVAAPLASAGPGRAPKHMDELFTQMLDQKASDLHLKSGKQPMIRVHGDMAFLEGRPPLSPEELWALLVPIMPERNRKQYEEVRDTDFAYELPTGSRMRCNVFKDIVGVGAVFRQIPSKILTVKDLNVPQAVVKLCDYPKGLILVTGPTGSGKSTTLAALIDYVNDTEASHIITIEDPVEFVHKDKKSLINQRELGVSTMSFKAALRAALREDPDVVLVGELRDLETTEIAIETAETGHLVFATLHTNTAAATVDRIINQFPADRQEQIRLMLSTSLLGVVSQTLCKKTSGGRIAALEVLLSNAAVSNLIREGKTFQIPTVMQTGKGIGMQTLNDALVELVKAKQIDAEEAYRCSVEKKEMIGALTRAGLRGSWTSDAQAAG